MNAEVIVNFGSKVVSNREINIPLEILPDTGMPPSSGRSDAGDAALVMAGTYLGAAAGLLLTELVFALLRSLL